MYRCGGCGNTIAFKEYVTISSILVFDKETGLKTNKGNQKFEGSYVKCLYCEEDSLGAVDFRDGDFTGGKDH